MLPSPDTVKRRTALIHDMLVDNEAIRDELSDDDAVTFMEWGRVQAGQVAARLPSDVDDEAVYEAGGTLSRLMSTIKRIIIRRRKKDVEWLTSKLERLNKLSGELWGAAAPALSEGAISTWVAGHPVRIDSDLLREFMAQYALPVTPDDTPDDVAKETPDAVPSAPPIPLSASVDLHSLELPGRTPPPTGENNEQE
ncbi:MAG: hypothetical protein K8S97_14980 [Anaerolineae bacterium]|nr:hypothetical protein [Anaerolineae bacterium]